MEESGNELFVKACKDLCAIEGLLESDPESFWTQCDKLLGLIPEEEVDGATSSIWFLHYRALQFAQVVELYDRRDIQRVADRPAAVIEAIHNLDSELRTPFCLQRNKLRPEASPTNLLAEGISHNQVCGMWGFIHEDGTPDIAKLDKELSNPGSVANESYEHPSMKTHLNDRQNHRRAYEKAFSKAQESHDPYGGQPVCPETPEELFNQGVEVDQAAKMLQKSVDEVQAIWNSLETELGPQEFIPAVNELGQDVEEYKPPVFAEKPGTHEMYSTEGVTDIPEESIVDWSEDSARLNYGEYPKSDLKAMCKDASINIAGNVSVEKLIDRLIEHDKAEMSQGVG